MPDFGKITEKEKDETLKSIITKKLAKDPLRVPVDQLKDNSGKKPIKEGGTISRGTARY